MSEQSEQVEGRVTVLEGKIDRFEMIVERHSTILERIADKIEQAIEIQGNSLSIPVLKDVLVPMVMRLFSFFAVLVLGVVGGVLGIKWLIVDFLAK